MPGDPSNNSILSATPAFGGIDVSWSYPATNPHAVSYTKIYRATSNNFGTAIQIAEVAGAFFYDKLDSGLTYYYWIRIISVNGTVGELIGPASAMAKPTIQAMIELLTGQIDAGLLATSLKNQLDQISVLNTNLLNEVVDRETGETTLAAAMADVSAGVAQANTFILNEIATRTSQNSAMAEAIDGVVVTLGGDIAAVTTAMTATIAEVDGLATDIDAMYTAKVTVNGLVGGFGIHNDGDQVEAGFDVDKFWIGRTSTDKRKPFIVSDGVVYIDQAAILSLSADKISAGSLNSAIVFAGKLMVGTLPVLSGTTMTGAGAVINNDGTFAIGNTTANITYNGTVLTLNGPVVASGNILGNAITEPAAGEAFGVSAPYLTPATALSLGSMNTTVSGVAMPVYLHLAIEGTLTGTTAGTLDTTATYRIKFNGTVVGTVSFSVPPDSVVTILKSVPFYVASPPTGSFTITVDHVRDQNGPGSPSSIVSIKLFALGTKR